MSFSSATAGSSSVKNILLLSPNFCSLSVEFPSSSSKMSFSESENSEDPEKAFPCSCKARIFPGSFLRILQEVIAHHHLDCIFLNFYF